MSRTGAWDVEDESRAATALLEEALFLAIEIDSLAEAGRVDESLVLRLRNLELGPEATPILAGLWLRMGSLVANDEFDRAWRAQSPHARSYITKAMLAMQPDAAVNLLAVEGLRAVLTADDDPDLHRAIAKAIAVNPPTGSKRCLAVMSEEGQIILAPELAGATAFAESATVPAWIVRLPERPRRAALLRFALGALGAGSESAYVSALDHFGSDELIDLSSLVENELSCISAAGLRVLVHHYHLMPGNPDLEIDICTRFIRDVEECRFSQEEISSLVSHLSDEDFAMLEKRAALRPERLNKAQKAALQDILGHVTVEAVTGAADVRQGSDESRSDAAEDDEPDGLSEIGCMTDWQNADWNDLENRVAKVQRAHRRAEALTFLAPAIPAAYLASFGAIANGLPNSEWRREAKKALFARAVSLDLNPWSIIRGVDRRDALLALIVRRLRRGQLDVFQHGAWRRLDRQHKTFALRYAIEQVAEEEDEIQRRRLVGLLCTAIGALPTSLGAITAVQFVKRFDRDPAVESEHLWRLTKIENLSPLHRRELMKVIATAFWLRGEDEAGARCHAEAEASVMEAAANQGDRGATVVALMRGGLDPEIKTNEGGFLDWDGEDKHKTIARRLATCNPDQRAKWVGRLLLEGHASALLLALETEGLSLR